MDITRQLEEPASYTAVFERLHHKAKQSPYLLGRGPLDPNLTLQWVLLNQKLVTQTIIKSVKNRTIISETAKANQIFLDKQRVICSQAWPQKILQAATASLISKAIEPHYSPQLFSYRKGLSSNKAIIEFSKYINKSYKAKTNLYILRRDILGYDQAIDLNKLRAMYQTLLAKQDPYFWNLLDSFLKPKITNQHALESEINLPMGYHITPLSENIYLSALDKYFDQIKDIFYLRYGDDIVIAGTDKNILTEAIISSNTIVQTLGLEFNPLKTSNICFVYPEQRDIGIFKQAQSIDYLGMNISNQGQVFLSNKKLLALKKEFKKCVRVSSAMNQSQNSNLEAAFLPIINSLNLLITAKDRNPLIDTILHTTIARRPQFVIVDICLQACHCRLGGGNDRL